MYIILVYLILCLVVAIMGARRGAAFLGLFLIALVLSPGMIITPAVALVVLLITPKPTAKTTP